MISRRNRVFVGVFWGSGRNPASVLCRRKLPGSIGDVLLIPVWKDPNLQGPAVLARPDATISFYLRRRSCACWRAMAMRRTGNSIQLLNWGRCQTITIA
jgi:hypothetical protein